MKPTGWRNLCLVLGAVCLAQLWRSCTASEPPTSSDGRTSSAAARSERATVADHRELADPGSQAAGPEPAGGATGGRGITLPAWAVWLAPHPGEDLRAYRDRMLPVAQAAIAPQRARVARLRDDFAQLANLDSHQRAGLERAAQDTASDLQDRVMGAVVNGELAFATWKPMTGVSTARDLLDILARGNQQFLDSLRDDQRARLAGHPFDFGDYLVFSTPWEDILKLLD
jgi:hypothetical protein